MALARRGNNESGNVTLAGGIEIITWHEIISIMKIIINNNQACVWWWRDVLDGSNGEQQHVTFTKAAWACPSLVTVAWRGVSGGETWVFYRYRFCS